jgi:hypothetical protein
VQPVATRCKTLQMVAGACLVLIVRRSSTSPISIVAKSRERISQAIVARDTRWRGQVPMNRGTTIDFVPIRLVQGRIPDQPGAGSRCLQQTASPGGLSREGAGPTVTFAAHRARPATGVTWSCGPVSRRPESRETL